MTEWAEQWICITFWVKLEQSSAETTWMIQKAAAMGNRWLAASSGQCTHSCITFCAEFLGETSNHPGDSHLLQPRFGALWLLVFPQTKINLKGKRFQTVSDIQENTRGQLMWRVWGPKVPTVNRSKASLSCIQCFLYLVSCVFFNKCLYFS